MAAAQIMSTTGSLSKIIREQLEPNMMALEPKVDPFMSKVAVSSDGVVTQYGRGFQKIQTFVTGMGGAVKNVGAAGPTDIVTDVALTGQVQAWDQTKVRTFPGLSRNVDPGYVQKTIGLVQFMGSMTFPLQFYMANALDPTIIDPIKIKMKGFAKNLLQMDCNAIYAENAVTKAYVTAATGAVGGSKWAYSSNILTILMDSSSLVTGRIARLIPGTPVSYVDVSANGGAGATVAWGMVISTDYVGSTKQVKVYLNASVTVGDGDFLVTADSHRDNLTSGGESYGVSGLNNWIVTSGSPYGLSLTTHPQFKSISASLSGGVLDETVLNKYIAAFYDGYGDMYSLDGVLTTNAALVAILDSFDGLGRFIRDGKALDVKMGWTSIGYVWNGQDFEFAASRYMTPGTAYIWKWQDNVRKLIPPNAEGMSGAPGFQRGCMFVAPFMGSKNIFLPERYTPSIAESGSASYTDVGALTEFQIAPCVGFREFVPEQLPGIKLTSVAEIAA